MPIQPGHIDSVLADERARQLAVEESLAAQAMVDAAKMRRRNARQLAYAGNPTHNAIKRSIVVRTAAALASEHVVPIMDVEAAPAGTHMLAYTDFERIVVRYTPHDDLPLLCATLRGLIYHEGGHIRWTAPFPALRVLAGDVQANPNRTGVELQRLRHAWNALEDQRMETAVTGDSPRKAAFFTPMVLTELTGTPEHARDNWPLLIWRRYVPKHVRTGARTMWVAANSEALAVDMEQCVDTYVRATDAATMWQCVEQFADLLDQAHTGPRQDGGSGDHTNQPGSESRKESADKLGQPVPIDPKQEQDGEPGEGESGAGDDESTGDTQGAGESADDGDTEAQGGDATTMGGGEDGEGDADSAAGQGESGKGQPGQGAGTTPGDHGHNLDQNDLNEAMQDAYDKMVGDSTVLNDVEAYRDALDNAASVLPPYCAGRWADNASEVLVAENLADDMVQSFAASTMDRQPGWVQGERSGILNVGRYMVAQEQETGDMNVFSRWQDDDQPGANLAVSVLLDYSSSMGSHMTALSQVGYACKLACSRLDIPCTVLLWDTDATVLYDANDMPDGMPTIGSAGGTNPTTALADIDNHRYGKARHLVIIMTDGGWSVSGPLLASYATDPGRFMLGVGYSPDASTARQMAQGMKQFAFTDVMGCSDLFDIPRALELLLIDLG